MDQFEQLITLISAGLGFVVTLTGVLISWAKNAKTKKRLEAVNELATVLQKFIIEAEEFTNFTGEEKKTYVMTKANRYALKNNLPFDEQQIDQTIENLISISKNVNKRDQDMQTESDEIVLCNSSVGKVSVNK